jgi:hypothetical protein
MRRTITRSTSRSIALYCGVAMQVLRSMATWCSREAGRVLQGLVRDSDAGSPCRIVYLRLVAHLYSAKPFALVSSASKPGCNESRRSTSMADCHACISRNSL